jgi:hypothetical protein
MRMRIEIIERLLVLARELGRVSAIRKSLSGCWFLAHATPTSSMLLKANAGVPRRRVVDP